MPPWTRSRRSTSSSSGPGRRGSRRATRAPVRGATCRTACPIAGPSVGRWTSFSSSARKHGATAVCVRRTTPTALSRTGRQHLQATRLVGRGERCGRAEASPSGPRRHRSTRTPRRSPLGRVVPPAPTSDRRAAAQPLSAAAGSRLHYRPRSSRHRCSSSAAGKAPSPKTRRAPGLWVRVPRWFPRRPGAGSFAGLCGTPSADSRVRRSPAGRPTRSERGRTRTRTRLGRCTRWACSATGRRTKADAAAPAVGRTASRGPTTPTGCCAISWCGPASPSARSRPSCPSRAAFEPPPVESVPVRALGSVVVATGFRSRYTEWIDVPGLVDEQGFPVHVDGESVVAPDLHFVGVHFLRRRRSALLFGVGDDAAATATRIATRWRPDLDPDRPAGLVVGAAGVLGGCRARGVRVSASGARPRRPRRTRRSSGRPAASPRAWPRAGRSSLAVISSRMPRSRM